MTADGERVVLDLKAEDGKFLQIAAVVDLSFAVFHAPPIGGERNSEILDIRLACSPVLVKIARTMNLALFPLGKFGKYGRARLAVQTFAVQADLTFPHGERQKPLAVRGVEKNFVAFYVGFPVNRFTNFRIWYIIIFVKNLLDELFRVRLFKRIKNIYHICIIS